MKRVYLVVGLLLLSLTVRKCHAYYGGYDTVNGSPSVWASVVPGLCPQCTQYQVWDFADIDAPNTRWSEVYADPYGRIYWQRSNSSTPVLLATARPGTAISVSQSRGATVGAITVRVDYTTTNGLRTYQKSTATIPGWQSAHGYGTVYTWGSQATIPAGIMDTWQSTLPYTSPRFFSGASVCGSPSIFTVKASCP